MTKAEVIRKLRENRLDIKKRFHAEIVALYGSYARDEQSAESDLDLLYQLEENTIFGLVEMEELENYLKNLFNVPAVDLANSNYLNPVVELEIQSDLVYV
ncbi:nucleotidyltransferase family protein [Lewinella sp. 4G2]|uniref:nucleotidyltransferase family protein n=1 Tax=Lewinella sp. 4G2 TaxID=1803372 RepID=UPI0007DEDBBF|nr:nucleotidyltransferase domain-containing protein [Lewinella sp. 4G2]OAV46281.1 hypothetical protein A3850_018670 [Lewinella sp. 4G2]